MGKRGAPMRCGRRRGERHGGRRRWAGGPVPGEHSVVRGEPGHGGDRHALGRRVQTDRWYGASQSPSPGARPSSRCAPICCGRLGAGERPNTAPPLAPLRGGLLARSAQGGRSHPPLCHHRPRAGGGGRGGGRRSLCLRLVTGSPLGALRGGPWTTAGRAALWLPPGRRVPRRRSPPRRAQVPASA